MHTNINDPDLSDNLCGSKQKQQMLKNQKLKKEQEKEQEKEQTKNQKNKWVRVVAVP